MPLVPQGAGKLEGIEQKGDHGGNMRRRDAKVQLRRGFWLQDGLVKPAGPERRRTAIAARPAPEAMAKMVSWSIGYVYCFILARLTSRL